MIPCAQLSMKFIDYSGIKFTAYQVIGEISENRRQKRLVLVFYNIHNPNPNIPPTYRRTSASSFGRDVLK